MIEGNETIKFFKEQIELAQGIKMKNFELSYQIVQKRTVLKDSHTISSYKIKNGSEIHMKAKKWEFENCLFITSSLNYIMTIQFNQDQKVLSFKQEIEEFEGIPQVMQELLYRGQVLDNNKTLKFY